MSDASITAPASVPAPAARPRLTPALKRRIRRSVLSLVVFVTLWEIVGRYLLPNPLFFAPLSKVVVTFGALWQEGVLQEHMVATFSEVIYGVALAAVFGITFGVVSGVSQTFRDYTEVYVIGLYATPLIAIAPMLILWLGIGVASKVAIVFLLAVFPIIINTQAGVLNAEPAMIEVARSFGATRSQLALKVLVPSAIPYVLTGLRLAVGRGIIGAVVGEVFGANVGLGYLIYNAGQTFDVAALFVGVLCVAMAGIGLTLGLQAIENRAARWRREPQPD